MAFLHPEMTPESKPKRKPRERSDNNNAERRLFICPNF
jgi:hypothetical protein